MEIGITIEEVIAAVFLAYLIPAIAIVLMVGMFGK